MATTEVPDTVRDRDTGTGRGRDNESIGIPSTLM
jgi:hypothetical protein